MSRIYVLAHEFGHIVYLFGKLFIAVFGGVFPSFFTKIPKNSQKIRV